MCLAVPAKVIEVSGSVCRVEMGGNVREVDLTLMDKVEVGEFLLVHAGFAIGKIDREEALETTREAVDIRRRLKEDLYLNFAGMSDSEEGKAVIDAYVFPLVSWIWIGFWVLLGGTLVCLIPSKTRLQFARTAVVGVAARNVPAPKQG